MKPNIHRRTDPGVLVEHPREWDHLIGKVFGRLAVLGYAGRRNQLDQKLITCRCSCGLYLDAMPWRLRSGNTQSCGCLFHEAKAARNIAGRTHGHASGGRVSPLYACWQAMLNRCLKPKDKRYKDYGARGITVSKLWQGAGGFENFLADVGERPDRFHTLDREDNDGNYEPGNVRWARSTVQQRNKRNTKRHELAGQLRPLGEWIEISGCGLTHEQVRRRMVKYGWALDEALGTPVGGGGRVSVGDRIRWIPPAIT